MKNILKRIGLGVVSIIVVVGFKFWNKAESHDSIKDQLIELCSGDSDCVLAVEQNFDRCFEHNYSIGGRRRSGSLNENSFLNCFNTIAGKQYFFISEVE